MLVYGGASLRCGNWGMDMGAIHVNATIRNPAERGKCWEGRFLVDTGATDSVAPKRHLHATGLK